MIITVLHCRERERRKRGGEGVRDREKREEKGHVKGGQVRQ